MYQRLIQALIFLGIAFTTGADPLILTGTIPFMDTELIAESTGIRRVPHAPIPSKNTIPFTKAWEGTISNVTVFKDESLYRMYYRGHGGNVICYAQSTDGKTWIKPNLYQFNFNGSYENNIVFNGLAWGSSVFDFVPFRDLKPGVSVDAKYKALAMIETQTPPAGLDAQGLAYWNQGWRLAAFAFKSQDGYNWLPMSGTPVLTAGTFDSQNTVRWDSQAGHYVCCFSEYRDADGEVNRESTEGYQQFMKTVSDDFLNWQTPVWVTIGNSPRVNLNALNVSPLPGVEDGYVGFPHRYFSRRARVSGAAGASGSLLMTSRDMVQWDVFPDAWLTPVVRASTRLAPLLNNMVCNGLVSTASDIAGCPEEWSFYVTEAADSQGLANRLRRWTVRAYGLASAFAPFNGGEMTTKPFTFIGSRLVLNYGTSAAGSVRVEIQDAQGIPIPGYTLADCKVMFRDYVEHDAVWQTTGSVSSLSGSVIQLRFVLKDAHLYAFTFK